MSLLHVCAAARKGKTKKAVDKAIEQSSKYMKGKDRFLALRIAANLFSLAFRETFDNCSSLLFEKKSPTFFFQTWGGVFRSWQGWQVDDFSGEDPLHRF